ncbi:MAG: hypothetical protein ACXWUG_18220 [Polyangiales bacterium]
MDLRSGRCPSCQHGEILETTPEVKVDGMSYDLEASRGHALELWTCGKCGLSQLTVRDPGKHAERLGRLARRVRADPPMGSYDVTITREVPTDGSDRVAMETKLARLLGVDGRQVARMLDAPVPIVVARNLPWNDAEHARAMLARVQVEVELTPSEPIGYRG